MKGDLHVHTTFSDGKNTPEEMVLAALRKGMDYIGFSDHSYTSFDDGCCMKKEAIPLYQAEIRRLQEKYRGQINIYLGIEQDGCVDIPPKGYDYIIGSVHYLPMADGRYVTIDWSPEKLLEGANTYFGGDMYALIEAYYEKTGHVAEDTGCNIVGHFDLVAIFQDKTPLFDENHPRYISAWQRAVDRIMEKCTLFEINTGGMGRGYRTRVYPDAPIRDYIKGKGGKLILSSDSHQSSTLCWAFDELQNML